MRRLILILVTLALAAACSNSSGPSGPPPRATVNVVLQDSTYKPLLSDTASFYAKVGEGRRVRLVYQGSTPTDSGAEFLRFEVPNDGLYLKPDGDRKSTRLNSSHSQISYAVFCLKKKKIQKQQTQVR